ncbi:hypothetical protein NUM3379_40190 [Kineococcus sp. NUM-3379]
MSTRPPARHRAAARPLTPLTTATTSLRRTVYAAGRGTAVVAASTGLVVSLTGAADAAVRGGTATAVAGGATAVVGGAAAGLAGAAFGAVQTAAVAAPVAAPVVVAVETSFAALPEAPPPPPQRDADGVPADLVRFGNGSLPPEALHPIGQGAHAMWAPAAEAFQRMSEAAGRDGITLRVTDSYRSYAEQVALAVRKGLYGHGGLAARPGTSNHGWGLSIDVDTANGTLEWLRAHAAEFGYDEDVPGEPWHWTYTA